MWAKSRNVGGHIGIVQGFDTRNNGESNVQDMETWDMQGCMDNDSKIIVLHPLFGCCKGYLQTDLNKTFIAFQTPVVDFR